MPASEDKTDDSLIPVEVKDKYSDVKNEITDFVKSNPLASVALATGVGFLLARLFAGRKE